MAEEKMKKIIPLLICLVVFIGCVPKQPPKTQLQIREFQTRIFDTNNMKMVMKAMLNVLQDDAFIVKNVNLELGFLSGTKEIDVTDQVGAFFAALGGTDARYRKNAVIECSANVSEFGKQCKVRINFQQKVFDNKGGVMKVDQIEDEKYYQDFFSKVSKGIFLQKEKL